MAAPCWPLLCLPVFCHGFCPGSRPIPWLWLCSQVLHSALLLLSFIPQLVPSPCPPSHSLPGFIHFTAPKDLSLLFASALSRFFSPGHVALFFLTSTGDLTSFHRERPQVYSVGGPVPESHHRKAKPKPERPECTNNEQVLHYFIPQLAVQRLLNRHAVH